MFTLLSFTLECNEEIFVYFVHWEEILSFLFTEVSPVLRKLLSKYLLSKLKYLGVVTKSQVLL